MEGFDATVFCILIIQYRIIRFNFFFCFVLFALKNKNTTFVYMKFIVINGMYTQTKSFIFFFFVLSIFVHNNLMKHSSPSMNTIQKNTVFSQFISDFDLTIIELFCTRQVTTRKKWKTVEMNTQINASIVVFCPILIDFCFVFFFFAEKTKIVHICDHVSSTDRL